MASFFLVSGLVLATSLDLDDRLGLRLPELFSAWHEGAPRDLTWGFPSGWPTARFSVGLYVCTEGVQSLFLQVQIVCTDGVASDGTREEGFPSPVKSIM